MTQQQVNAAIAAANAKLQSDLNSCSATATAIAVNATATVQAGRNGNSYATPAVPANPNATSTLKPDYSTCAQLAQKNRDSTVATQNQLLQSAQAKVSADQQRLNLDTATGNANIQTAQSRVNTDQARINTDQASANNSSASSQSSVTSLQSKLNQDLTQLAAYKRDMDNAILLAPHDGVVTVINGNVGGIPGVPANASSASTTTTASTFIQLVDTQALQVQANVNETDTGSLQVGDAATFTVNAFNGRTFIGTVSAISPNGQTVSNVVTYPVTIDVNASSLQGANLLPNMTANVTITVVQHSGVLLIPVEAVNFARLSSTSNPTTGRQALVESKAVAQAMRQARQLLANLESNNADIVAVSPIPTFVLEKPDDNFVVKPVVLGLTDGTQYEVLDGLTTNDVIVDGNRTGEQFGRPGGTNTTAQGG
ncbi:MAG: HlyD family efflux transporter periplasmic adaptor subunit [Chloroflexi bacterium]|nr:MAG: HlyD family efflux transporter periplasmic adaptor subunit [Chloroflexota bacterium]